MTLLKPLLPAAIAVALLAAPCVNAAEGSEVTKLMSKPLPEFPGKEALMISVVYPPGGSNPVHRHNAHSFVYVLEGSLIMQVKDGKQVTLTPGQTFYESPGDVHIVGKNASNTEPAKFIVLLIKEEGAPVLKPVAATE